MKQRLERIIKSNPYINKLYTFIGSFLVKVIGFFIREDKNTILFVSYMGKNFNDSPKAIYDQMIEDPYFKDYTFVWAFNDVNKYNITEPNTRIVKMDSLNYLLTALRASYWITNVNIERGLHFKKDYTKSVNTWHGVPLKKVGNDVAGRNDFDFSDTNLFCYSSEYEYAIYKEAFKLGDANLYKVGMPRNDLILENDPEIKEKVRKKYQIENKKIILYAPTWRDDPEDLKLMDLKQWEEQLSEDYVLLVKVHGLAQKFNLTNNKFVLDVSDYEETSELIIAADILITDYSSIMFDFALLNKAVFIYTTDYEKYARERGLYFDLKQTGLSVFEKDTELLEYLRVYDEEKEKKITEEFNRKFIEVRRPDATEDIISLIKEENL